MNTITLNPNTHSNGHISTSKTATPLDPKNYLSKELEDERIIQALNSSEGLSEQPIQHHSEIKKPEVSFVRDTLPVIGYSTASTLHALAWLHRIGHGLLPKTIGEFLDKHAVNFLKTVNFFNYGGKAIVSFKANNALDSISKALFPLMVSFVNLENMFLASGLSSGTTMISSAHNPRITNRESFMGNLKEHVKAYGEMIKEVFSPGGIQKLLSTKDFHLMHIGGNMNFFGGLGGLIADGVHPVMKSIFSFIRNSGGMICDIAKIFHGDTNYVISGVLYIFTHTLDIWQAGIAKTKPERSRTISHLVQSVNSIANYFYTKPSNTMADHTFKDRVREQRLVPRLSPQAIAA